MLRHHPNKTHPTCWKREVATTLEKDCDDEVKLWNYWETFAASLFLPGLAASKEHSNLENLSCCVVKQANMTSRILGEIADDSAQTQHAVLQNRMSIDFLLLAHGHGCEEFDSLCCMDLEDQSKSIHGQIKRLIDHTNKIKEDKGFFCS